MKSESVKVGCAAVFVLVAALACKSRHRTSETDPPLTTEDTAIATLAPETTKYVVGEKITVLWNGQKSPSTIVSVLPHDKYKVHYTGWASSYDETVGLDRIVGSGVTAATATATAKPNTNGGGGGVASDAPCPGPGITQRCNGRCVNLQEDDNNCGSCGTVCSGGKHCDGHLFCRDSEGNL